MSDIQFEEDEKNLLCPDEIDLTDYEKCLEPILNNNESELFKKWYTKTSDPTKTYRQNFYKLNENFLFNESSNVELDNLFSTLKQKFEHANTSNLGTNEEANSEISNSKFDLKLKYLKSIQQEEIELVVKHLDPSSVVWFNLTHQNSVNVNTNSPESKFNFIRYKTVLDLLQKHIFQCNYKECVISEHEVRKTIRRNSSFSNNSHSPLNEKLMNEFLYNSIKSLIDNYISELNKKQSNNIVISNLLLRFLSYSDGF